MVREIAITWPRRRAYSNVLQFKITLLEADPPVWRRIQVPDYYTFYDLHVAIQDAMGWLDSHLHDFKIQPRRRACLDIRIESPFALDDLEEAAPLLSTEAAVADFIQEPGDRALYTYDYGDDWRMTSYSRGPIPGNREKSIRSVWPASWPGRLRIVAEFRDIMNASRP